MAIITCYECGDRVSDRAAACPHCGAPMRSVQRRTAPRRKKSSGARAEFKIIAGGVAVAATVGAVGMGMKGEDVSAMVPGVVLIWILFGLTFVTSIFGKR